MPAYQFAHSSLRVVGGVRGALTLRSGGAAMTFEIDLSRVHQYCWRVRTNEGEVAISGEGYVRKRDCVDTVNALQSCVLTAAMIDLTAPPSPTPPRRE